ncbi:hypothetical protein RFI_10777 [Reticulomyxa filosa]|uniref:Uncharacterized protein n=1 Tax=Reticulomyxa filosa TaxID=46433 RepID=X6NKC2_RETFI|nr:hypothetical protein RFI_10777 [Reticulomyxa filosa]|eukprot:ETO26358.1 hypothetical protein RFI_10777 [Reticulomyxa filosa]
MFVKYIVWVIALLSWLITVLDSKLQNITKIKYIITRNYDYKSFHKSFTLVTNDEFVLLRMRIVIYCVKKFGMPGKKKKKVKAKSKAKTKAKSKLKKVKPESSVVGNDPKKSQALIQFERKFPAGDDWIILSFCLVPWEAKAITMFFNFEETVCTHMKLESVYRIMLPRKSLCCAQVQKTKGFLCLLKYRIAEKKIGGAEKLILFTDPPTVDKPIPNSWKGKTLSQLGFTGGIFEKAPRHILFFDFEPPRFGFGTKRPMDNLIRSDVHLKKEKILLDPVLLAEPSKIMLNESEKLKQETELFLQTIRLQSRGFSKAHCRQHSKTNYDKPESNNIQ